MPGSQRDDDFFGINPGDSEKLIALFHKYPVFAGYFSGHTHSNRVRYVDGLPGVPFAEVGAVKEFPELGLNIESTKAALNKSCIAVNDPKCLKWTTKH